MTDLTHSPVDAVSGVAPTRRSESVRAAGQAPVAVVGLGHVGLALAADLLAGGRSVVGFERDGERALAVGEGRSPFAHLPDAAVAPRRDAEGRSVRIDVAGDLARVRECAGLVLCLPTPLGADGRPDLSAIEEVARGLVPHLAPGHVVVLASTVWPGATRRVLAPILASSGLELGRELFVASSPEREDPGRHAPASRSVPRLVGGLDSASTARAVEMLRSASDALVPVGSAEVAELAKMHENLFRAVNVALVNELKQIATALGIDVWQVLEAAATKPYGYMGFEPGPGLGGHCLPIDPHYLAFAANEAGARSRFVDLVAEIGREMPLWVADRVELALGRAGKRLLGARVLLVGVAYKAGVADLRESPALALWDELERRGAEVSYTDPLVPVLSREGREHRSRALAETSPDVAVLLTPQPGLDLTRIARAAPLVVDTRGVLRRDLGDSPGYCPA